MAGENTKVYFKQGGDALVIKTGGAIQNESGQQLLGPTSNKTILRKFVPDLSAEKTYYIISPVAGDISKLSGVADGAVGTADATATFSINGTPVTTGVVTFVSSGSAAGDKTADVVPTAAKTVAVGDKISFVVTGGGSGGTPSGELAIEITGS